MLCLGKTDKGMRMQNLAVSKDSKIQLGKRLQEICKLPKVPSLVKTAGNQGLTYIMNKETIVKIPVNAAQIKQLMAMASLFEILKHKTKVQTPALKVYQPAVADKKGEAMTIGCYPIIKGHVFAEMATFYDQDIDFRKNTVWQLGAFVADMHTLTPSEVDSLKIGTARDYLHVILFDEFKNETRDVPVHRRKALLEGVYNRIFDGCNSKTLCHMDLHIGNMCFDDKWEKLTGVFDFGSAIVAPKELEYMIISTVYDEELQAFKAGYKNQCQSEADFESPQFRRVCTYLSPFTRSLKLPPLIREIKQKI